MTTALGIAPDSTGKGVDPLTHRQVIKAHWENTGIICGLDVSGRSDLRFGISAGVAVCSRGNADGFTEAYWNGGQSPAVGAGDPSNPRIDVIWVKANDISQGDSNNAVVSGVTQGTPSANPVAPSIPAGCTRLMSMRMPAGASSTQSATPVDTQDYAIPYGASLGVLARIAENKDLQPSSNPAYTAPFLIGTFKMPTDRNLLLTVYACVSTPNKDAPRVSPRCVSSSTGDCTPRGKSNTRILGRRMNARALSSLRKARIPSESQCSTSRAADM